MCNLNCTGKEVKWAKLGQVFVLNERKTAGYYVWKRKEQTNWNDKL